MPRRALAIPLAAVLALTGCLANPVTSTRSLAPTFAVATPSVTVEPSSSATLAPSAEPTPSPTATPIGGLETLELRATGCPGGVVLEWSSSADLDFDHYTALRSPDAAIDPAWPPIAPAVDWGDTYVTDRFITSAIDASIIPTETIWNYRVMAYDAGNRPVAASPVRHARLNDVVELGPLTVEPGERAGATRVDWRLYGGLRPCFSTYRVFIGSAGGAADTLLTSVSQQDTTELETVGMHAGETYAIRVEAVRTTTLGGFLVAESEIATYTVP